MRCVTTVSYTFCLNALEVGPILTRRGLRQGDPLSLYLFLFCVEGLSNQLDDVLARGTIDGCKISPMAPVVSHLLFADDSFMFFKATMEEVNAVRSILHDYASKSGQAINFQKSGIFFSSIVRRDKQHELATALGVHNDIATSSYLDLSSLIVRSKKRVFGFRKDRVQKHV